jgi:hypothetical protein
MAYQTYAEYNATGLEDFFLYPAGVVNVFIPLLLVTIFMVTLLGTFFGIGRLRGRGDFAGSFAVAGYVTFFFSAGMMLVDGLINNTTVGVCLAVSIIGTIILLLTRD